jgi:CDP-diacylglycerol--serine O-phosphatidyltransferase
LKQIPNFITLLNLFCGSLGVIMVLSGRPQVAVYLMLAAAVFDFLDGMTARLFNAYSEIGKQLDSLADLISFGLLPGIMMYSLLLEIAGPDDFLIYSGLLIPAFSALRLAKFNIDTRQTTNFIGLPTPANALFFASVFYIYNMDVATGIGELIQQAVTNKWLVVGLIIGFSYLLISEIHMFSMKFTGFNWKGNEYRFVFVILALVLFIAFMLNAMPLIIISYIIMSLVYNWRVTK